MKLNVVQFRKQIREALDAVERGEEVYITRHNKTFAIIKAPFNYLTTAKESSNIKPDIAKKNKRLPSATEYGKSWNAQAKDKLNVPQITTGEKPCCENKKPCQHWQYEDTRQVWVNSLSGRERNAE